MQRNYDDDESFGQLGLRPATDDDKAFLLTLFASTRADELALLAYDSNLQQMFISMQFNAQTSQYSMSYPQAADNLILWNDAPIGRLLINRSPEEFTLVDIALLPAHRGLGIGTHLLRNLLHEAAAAHKPVKLSVWQSNSAKRLYKRMGFTTTNEDEVYCQMTWTPSN